MVFKSSKCENEFEIKRLIYSKLTRSNFLKIKNPACRAGFEIFI
jgi:hypothetical protein